MSLSLISVKTKQRTLHAHSCEFILIAQSVFGHVPCALNVPSGCPAVMFLHPVFSTSAILMKAAGSHSSLSPPFPAPLPLCIGTVEPEPHWLGLSVCNSLEREVPVLSMASLQGAENAFSCPSPHPFSATQGHFLFVSLL